MIYKHNFLTMLKVYPIYLIIRNETQQNWPLHHRVRPEFPICPTNVTTSSGFPYAKHTFTMADLGNDYITNSADPKSIQDLTTYVSYLLSSSDIRE